MSFVAASERTDGGVDSSEVECYRTEGGVPYRSVRRSDGSIVDTSAEAVVGVPAGDAYGAFWLSWLTRRPRTITPTSDEVTVADIFSGSGGLSVGIREACRALGLEERVVLAVDTNERALDVYRSNFSPISTHTGGIEDLVDGELGHRLTAVERRLARSLAGLTLAVGGPPCQGHSDLNNHTRRRDPKNALYLRMARFIEVVRPEHAIIENVPGVRHDRLGVVDRTRRALETLGYHVSEGVLAADQLGWAQRRKRHLLVATRGTADLELATTAALFAREPRPVTWVLAGMSDEQGLLNTSARHSAINDRRIRYLFEHGLYELPDEERPDCHRLKPHSYRSVYGRMRPDQPAPTITSGFGLTGQGRFVHPFEQRTITPREAARIQGFPDWFDFDESAGRRALQEMIGNAVPSRLGYVAAMSVLR